MSTRIASSDGGVLELSPPKGESIAKKWTGFMMLGEPGWMPHIRESVFVGAVGSGKTTSLIASLLYSAVQYPGSRIALVRDTRENLRVSTMQTLEDMAAPLIAAGKYQYVKSQNIIRIGDDFKNPDSFTEIYLFGLDDPRAHKKLVGTEWFRVYVDQLERIDRSIYEQLILRIRQKVYDTNGNLATNYIKSTANLDEGRKTWLHKRFQIGSHPIADGIFEKVVEGTIKAADGLRAVKAYRVMFKAEYGENLSLNPQYDEFMVLAGDTAKRFMAGDFEANFDLLFPEFEAEEHVYTNRNFEHKFHDLYIGLDFGSSSPTVAIFALVDRYERRIFVEHEYISHGMDAEEYAIEIVNIIHRYMNAGVNNVYIYADPSIWNRTGMGVVADAMETVIRANIAAPVVFDKAFIKGTVRLDDAAIDNVKRFIKRNKLYVNRRAEGTISMLMDVTWEDVHKDRHPMTDLFDALRYLVDNVPVHSDEEEDEDEDNEPEVAWWSF